MRHEDFKCVIACTPNGFCFRCLVCLVKVLIGCDRLRRDATDCDGMRQVATGCDRLRRVATGSDGMRQVATGFL